MNGTRVRSFLKKAALCVALPLLVAVSNVQAAVTYYFYVESLSAQDDPYYAPITADDLLWARSTIADKIRVTLLDPAQGGGLSYSALFDMCLPDGSTWEECWDVRFSQRGINLDGYLEWFVSGEPWRWHSKWADISLRDSGDGLFGGLYLGVHPISEHPFYHEDYLTLNGVGDDWTGEWFEPWGKLFGLSEFSPFSGQYRTLNITGEWRVPLPGTLALLGLGLVGLGALRRRRC